MDPFHLLNRDARVALEEFSREFDAALATAEVDMWAARLGMMRVSNAIKTTYPIPVSAAGYKRREGDDKLRQLFDMSLSITPVQWYDGVEADAYKLRAPDFTDWAGEPTRIAFEATRQPNVQVAAMLEANPLLDLYRIERPGGSVASTLNLFDTGHPFNVFDSSAGTFDNDVASGTYSEFNTALVQFMKEYFRSIKQPNGKTPLGLRLTDILVPAALEEQARDFFERDMIVEAIKNVAETENVGGATQRNRHAGTVTINVSDELTDDGIIYGFGKPQGGMGPAPWIYQSTGTPEEITYDEEDTRYKDTGMLGKKYILTHAAVAALPHGIIRVDLG